MKSKLLRGWFLALLCCAFFPALGKAQSYNATITGTVTDPTAAAIPNVCGAYKVIRPILLLLLGTPFIPQKWKDAIKVFMGVLDALCP